MKAWTVSELDNIIASLKPLLGARLQEIKTLGNDIVLGFFTAGDLLWLWVDLNALRPVMLPWSQLPLPLASQKNPVNLFLRAHFVGRPLLSVERDEKWGRVVRLGFGGDDGIEIRLFPHGANFLAVSAGKIISWDKRAELSAPLDTKSFGADRNLDELREQWLGLRSKGPAGKKAAKADPVGRVRLDLERKQKALLKVEQELQRKSDLPWREVGEWIKREQTLEVRAEWAPFVDKRRKLSWNVDHVFGKARDVEGKMFGTEQRRNLLLEEIRRLELELEKPVNQMTLKPEKSKFQPLKDSDAEGRTLRINEELVAFAGKNASDNLKLLRKARAWDFWLHLQDRPGAHVILFRNKSTTVSDAVLRQVMGWFVKLQLGAKFPKHAGEKMKVIVTECRHVRPIKGDRLGRVNYQNERILIYQVP